MQNGGAPHGSSQFPTKQWCQRKNVTLIAYVNPGVSEVLFPQTNNLLNLRHPPRACVVLHAVYNQKWHMSNCIKCCFPCHIKRSKTFPPFKRKKISSSMMFHLVSPHLSPKKCNVRKKREETFARGFSDTAVNHSSSAPSKCWTWFDSCFQKKDCHSLG